jgi:hypothetical protein
MKRQTEMMAKQEDFVSEPKQPENRTRRQTPNKIQQNIDAVSAKPPSNMLPRQRTPPTKEERAKLRRDQHSQRSSALPTLRNKRSLSQPNQQRPKPKINSIVTLAAREREQTTQKEKR